ncbi:hypothetical protein NESM_000221400 [Novymonas esmeraldas]|uniref:200 kDa antigen p200 n=1 Tax=Novymonas esmeraldas TaxID=1808958 RepID=A0AAW0F5W9_9TRYP
MSGTAGVVTPREVASVGHGSSPASRSASAGNSLSSYARWRSMRGADASDRSLPSHPRAADVVATCTATTALASVAEASTSSLPTVLPSPHHHHNRCSLSDALPSVSINDERSPRVGVYVDDGDTHRGTLKDSADSVRWSLISMSSAPGRSRGDASPHKLEQQQPPPHHREAVEREDNGALAPTARVDGTTHTSRTAAIAAAVPRIVEAQTSATEAYAGRWSHELQQSSAAEAELRRLYQTLERELAETRRAHAAAEATHTREMQSLTRQLEQEKAERAKAEQDREDLLMQATTSPSQTPRGGALPGSDLVQRDGHHDHHAAAAAGGAVVSDVFYEKLREREERARARVRREFVRQAQESLYAEQRRCSEAETATEAALRRLAKAEEELAQRQEALQDATSVMEAKDVQLHERAIHIQELEAAVRLLEHQLATDAEAAQHAGDVASTKLHEAAALAALRQAELEAQRVFAHQLQEKLGLTASNLLDRENSEESVLRTVQELQARCRRLEADLESEVRGATALLQQQRQHAEDEARLLQERNSELKRRAGVVEAELAELRTRREYDGNEVAQLRSRYEKALDEGRIEIRSLQLQLERVTEAAQRRRGESATATEIERQQQATLVRQYAAETRAAQEEVSRVKAQLQRESEKHLTTVLELSQQITQLKQANTRLEHAVNVHEHERTGATRLLERARQELSQARDDRQRMGLSLVDLREDSRASSVARSHDGLLRRVAELESVRADLAEKLRRANHVIAELQVTPRASGMQAAGKRGDAGETHRRRHPAPLSIPPTDSFLRMSDDDHNDDDRLSRRQASGDVESIPRNAAGVVHVAPVMRLADGDARAVPATVQDLLEATAEHLQQILRDSAAAPHHQSVHENLPTAPPTLRERRRRSSLQPEEHEALDRVLVSCMAALECCHLKKTTSPFYSSFGDGSGAAAAAAAAALDTAQTSAAEVTIAPAEWATSAPSTTTRDEGHRRHDASFPSSVPAASAAPAPAQALRRRSSQDHSPQAPPARPRRSSQRSTSASAGEESTVAPVGHTALFHPRPLTERGAADAVQLTNGTGRDRPRPDTHKHTGAGRRTSLSGEDQRDELEAEPCWEGEEEREQGQEGRRAEAQVRSRQVAHEPPHLQRPSMDTRAAGAAPPARPRRGGGEREEQRTHRPPFERDSVATRSAPLLEQPRAAPHAPVPAEVRVAAGGEVEGEDDDDGILRWSPIPPATPNGALLATPPLQSASTPASPPPVQQQQQQQQQRQQHLGDATATSLFSNVHHVFPATSETALVIDVHQSTPPPVRRRSNGW